MKKVLKIVIFVVVVAVISVCYFLLKEKIASMVSTTKVDPVILPDKADQVNNPAKVMDFASINQEFLFSANIPDGFKVEYLPKTRAINVYDPSISGASNLDKSLMYVSFFKASRFLTLNTVDITRQDKTSIKGREAILYEITKRGGIPDFYGQPVWRNAKHEALDIRLTQSNPSYFYSFAKNPALSQKVFDDFISSLIY